MFREEGMGWMSEVMAPARRDLGAPRSGRKNDKNERGEPSEGTPRRSERGRESTPQMLRCDDASLVVM